MKNQNLILYQPGCYGTFLEWLLNFMEDPSIDLPFTNSGNSHKFSGNFLEPKPKLFKHLNSGVANRYSRIHPGCLFDLDDGQTASTFNKELNFYKLHFEKILMLNYDQDTILWYENNRLDKILVTDELFSKVMEPHGVTKQSFLAESVDDPVLRFKHYIDQDINQSNGFLATNLQGWNKQSIYDFDVWEMRELLSFYWFSRNDNFISGWQEVQRNHPDVLFVSIHDLRENFFPTIKKITEHYGVSTIKATQAQLETIHQQWISLQSQIHKDVICKKIVSSLINKQWFDWSDIELSIVDEAWIQKSLRDHGVELKCYGLVKFPSNTTLFAELLEFTGNL